MNNTAERISFWTLINKSYQDQDKKIEKIEIKVPDLQRDYAEGRTDKATTQIRKNLISQICDCLKSKKPKNLNFIYGTLENNKFTPIDGQQRLTTLFLLHWYVFAMSENYTGKISELTRFKYATRTTTEDFCDLLCNTKKIELGDKKTLSQWFKDKNSFSGNISLDPSVKSMLVVLDDIDKTLNPKYCESTNTATVDFDSLAEYLISEECKIDFLWFDVGNFNSEDLYIKMNSRGKHLTDFESFKAKLQPSDTEKTILSDVFETTEEAIEFIGRINNQYTDLFYKLCGRNDFDNAMMNFFISVIKCDQFAYAGSLPELQNQSKIYRDLFNSDAFGNVFYEKFINKPVDQWREKNTARKPNLFDCVKEEELKKCLQKSIKKIDYVLSLSINNTKNYDSTTAINRELAAYTIQNIIKSNKGKITNVEHLKQYAIWEYIFQMKPSTEKDFLNFELWKRFIANVLDNAEDSKGAGFSDTADVCTTLCLIKHLIDYIENSKEQDIHRSILNAIDAFSRQRNNSNLDISEDMKGFAPPIKLPSYEERKKLELIVSNDEWFEAIINAENYFGDGQIIFLLRICDDDLNKFKHYLELSKKIFKSDKSVNEDNVRWESLQRAMLCCTDNTPDKMACMISSTNWRFHISNFSYKEMLAHGDVRPIFAACENNLDLNSGLENIAAPQFSDEEKWKEAFASTKLFEHMIDYNRIYPDSFSFTIAFRDNTILLLSGDKRTSAPSAEINTFKLYCSLENVANKKLHFEKGDFVVNEYGIPLRYVCVGNKKVGFSSKDNCFVDIDDISKTFCFDEAKAYLVE